MNDEMRSKLLEQFKEYGKLEFYEDDAVILWLIDAAAETLRHAGIPDTSESPLYRLAVTRLALHYYENREEIGGSSEMPMGMNWMIEQLRLNQG